MQRLLSVVRRPDAILAIVSVPGRGDAPFVSQRVPLSQVSEAVCPWRDKDVRAYTALARVPSMSRRAAQAIARTLIGSVCDPEAEIAEPGPLAFGAAPVDLRPQLCSPAGEERLLSAFADALPEGGDLPTWHWHRRRDIAALPAGFRLELLWGLHLSSWEQVELTLAAHRALGLEDDAALRAAVARLLSHADRECGLWWCDLLAEAEPAARTPLAALVVATGAHRDRPSPELRRVVERGDLPAAARSLRGA